MVKNAKDSVYREEEPLRRWQLSLVQTIHLERTRLFIQQVIFLKQQEGMLEKKGIKWEWIGLDPKKAIPQTNKQDFFRKEWART